VVTPVPPSADPIIENSGPVVVPGNDPSDVLILGMEKASTSESLEASASLSIGNVGKISPLREYFAAFLAQHQETMETEPLLLDSENCYDSDFKSDDNDLQWCKLLDKQDKDLLEIFNRSSYPVSIGNFVQILRPHWKFKFMTPSRVNLIVKTCLRLKILPEDFKKTIRGVRSESQTESKTFFYSPLLA